MFCVFSFLGLGNVEKSSLLAYATDDVSNSTQTMYECVTPEQFGAIGDGITDDTDAINAAIKKANGTCGRIIFENYKHYKCDRTVQLASNIELEMNGATLTVHEIITFEKTNPAKRYDGFHDIVVKNGIFQTTNSFAIAHVKNLLIENCTFLKCGGNHFIEMCASQNITIHNCRFLGQGTEDGIREMIQFDVCEPSSFRHFSDHNSAAYDYTPLDDVVIEGCFFSSYTEGTTYYPMHCAIGGHVCNTTQNTNITIKNCYIDGSDANGIFLNNWDHVVIEGCTLVNISDQPIGMRYSCNDVDIHQNTFRHNGSKYVIIAKYKEYNKRDISITCNFIASEGGIADIQGGNGITIIGNYCISSNSMIQVQDCEDCCIHNNFSF